MPQEHMPHPNNPELIDSAKDLYGAMAFPFEHIGEFNPLYYSVEFDFLPKKDRAIHLPGGVLSTLEHALDLSIDCKNKPWNIQINYDPQAEDLSVDTLTTSALLRGGAEKILVLKRHPRYGYFPFIADSHDHEPKLYQREDQVLEGIVFDKSQYTSIGLPVMNEMLDEAGFKMNSDQRPESWLAPALAESHEWRRTERIISPISTEGEQVTLERTQQFIDPGGSRPDASGHMQFCNEYVADNGVRQQLSVKFPVDDYTVEAPSVTISRLAPTNDPSHVADQGPGAYSLADLKNIPVTPELLDALHEDLLDTLGDIA